MNRLETAEELSMISSLGRLCWLHWEKELVRSKSGVRKIYWEASGLG